MRKKEKEFLNKEEVNRVLRQPRKGTLEGLRDFCILSLMINTGLRRAEICDLKKGSLKTETQQVKLHIYGKGRQWRKIPVKNKDLLTALAKYFKKVNTLSKPEAPMFFIIRPEKDGQLKKITFETIRYLPAKYVKLAGIDKNITPHSLRHTFLSLALQAGADLATVSALAGHANTSTTSLYLHTTDQLMEAAIERLQL